MGGGCLKRGITSLRPDEIESKCVVSLLRNGNHAIITIEGIKKGKEEIKGEPSTNNSIWMEVYDFLPKSALELSSESSSSIEIFFKNPTGEGRIRYRERDVPEELEWQKIWELFKFVDSGDDAEYLNWTISKVDYAKLRANIEEDMIKPPRFRMVGKDRFFGEGGHNCYTWAKEKLETIDIALETSVWDKLIAAEPAKHIQPQNSRCVIL